MCLNFTSIILIIHIPRFSLGSQVQNLFSYTNRGSKADDGRVPHSHCLENKNPRVDHCFPPAGQGVHVNVHIRPGSSLGVFLH